MTRLWAAIIVAVLLAAIASVIYLRYSPRDRPEAEVQAERRLRVTPPVEMAPAPLPSTLPLIGKAEKDADGYPLQTVDRAALRSLLWHKRYAELTSFLEQTQAEFESDWHREYWPADAAEAVGSGEEELLPQLDAWVKATPDSFAPYLARGTYWMNAAYLRRGAKWASETADSDFAAMKDALARAHADLDRALAINPRLIAALRAKLRALMAASQHQEMIEVMQEAARACPHCVQARFTYVLGLRPRWGGSYKQMAAFAKRELDPENPKTRFLAGYVHLDIANILENQKKYGEALVAIEQACALGEHWAFLLDRANLRFRRNEIELALTDLDRVLELRPGLPEAFFEKARAYERAGRWEEAGRSLLEGLRVDPTDSTARRIFDRVLENLIYDGWRLHEGGQKEAALRVYDLAAELAPGNTDVQRRRAFIISPVSSNREKPPEELAGLEERVRAAPDDFRAHQQLDYALARHGQWERVIESWTAFLSRNPGHGHAYLERGGAYFRMGKREEAVADARRACELGVNEGCLRAKQVSPGQ